MKKKYEVFLCATKRDGSIRPESMKCLFTGTYLTTADNPIPQDNHVMVEADKIFTVAKAVLSASGTKNLLLRLMVAGVCEQSFENK